MPADACTIFDTRIVSPALLGFHQIAPMA